VIKTVTVKYILSRLVVETKEVNGEPYPPKTLPDIVWFAAPHERY